MAESMDSLLLELQFEKAKSIALQVSHNEEKALRIKAEASLQELRRVHETLACDCEMSEEFIVNKLIGKIQRAHTEKEQLANDIEREEEGLTNNLLRKLNVLRSEKDVTDSEVEVLKKRLEKMRNEQEQTARKVEAEQELLSNNLFKKLQKTMQEKCELESQLSRSLSARNSTCNSLSSSINGCPDSPGSTKEMSDSSDMSIIFPNKRTVDSVPAFPTRGVAPSSSNNPSNQPNSAESLYMI